jgi:hypothetical protein
VQSVMTLKDSSGLTRAGVGTGELCDYYAAAVTMLPTQCVFGACALDAVPGVPAICVVYGHRTAASPMAACMHAWPKQGGSLVQYAAHNSRC